MTVPASMAYMEARARINRCIKRITGFMQTSAEYNQDRSNVGKRAKLSQMLLELKPLRTSVENDLQIMESSVAHKTSPSAITDHADTETLCATFDTLYFDLAAFAEVHQIPTTKGTHNSSIIGDTSQLGNTSAFQMPKRKFPSFSGDIKEWQSFDDLFNSILSHFPEFTDVERFEYLKTALQDEPRSLIAHLSLTATNYVSAWEILRARYGNKRDLARIHFDALLAPHQVRINDATSIKVLINTIHEHTSALNNLNFVTRQWSPILVHIFEKYMDHELRVSWELKVGDTVSPTINDFVDFLRSYIRSASIRAEQGSITKPQHGTKQAQQFKSRTGSAPRVLTTILSTESCPICKETHRIKECPQFMNKTPNERYEMTKIRHLCLNCLGSNHITTACKSKFSCRTCGKKHHSMLHFAKRSSTVTQTVSLPEPTGSHESAVTTCLVSHPRRSTVLLATMILQAKASDGSVHTLRALIDSGSEASFVTDRCADKLLLPRRRCTSQVRPFAGSTINVVSGIVTITLSAISTSEPTVTINTMIVPKIVDQTPHFYVSSATWKHLKDLPLADPTYNTPGPIDVLLGADIVPSIMTGERVTGQTKQPSAFNTIFGWIILGPADQPSSSTISTLTVRSNTELESALTRFWKLEEPSVLSLPTIDDTDPAEQTFTRSITHTPSGQFCLELPFKSPKPIIGDSKVQALNRLRQLEWRLAKDSELRSNYVKFMQDYLDNNHMELVPIQQRSTPHHFYIPHHCILRPDSQTTKLRVVFDASAKSSAGISLNDCLHTGPKLQTDLSHILMRSRVHKIIFMADIQQMYRQILIAEADRDYLRILWRFDPQENIEEYRLRTVTYGTSAAPFQAIRTLQHLSTIGKLTHPIASQVLLSDTFVDDILSGAESIKSALIIQKQIISLLSMGHFTLRKWASNAPEVITAVPEEARSKLTSISFNDKSETGVKVLGLLWDSKHDHFQYTIRCLDVTPTKRNVLSEIARIFDPLGLLSPVTFLTKHLMQMLWTAGIGWDDVIPPTAQTIWQQYRNQLPCLQKLRIPRRMTTENSESTELHAFSDSSERGYAAAIYLRTKSSTGVMCYLITAKSKVAPLKRVTIPRLELCGALLAAKLLKSVIDVLSPIMNITDTHAWTDSMTTLAWIKSSPHRWNTFVANRVSQLQDFTTPSVWRYVPTKLNPVDCASRGLFPAELLIHPLWWAGPAFLYEEPASWPITHPNNNSELPESRPTVALATLEESDIFGRLFERYSSLPKIIRIVGYCFRLKPHRHTTITLTPKEQNQALTVIIKAVQRYAFHDTIQLLTEKKPCTTQLRKLSPFLDTSGVLRVGGRILHASVPYEQKHPALVPKRHPFTSLLIHHYHEIHCHPGATTLQRLIQQQFWILSARQVVRSHLRRCIPCYRVRPKPVQPSMGNLPSCRLQQVKPFYTTGVDYAGPIYVKERRARNSKVSQVYICLFICMSTKALHLEVASDLSTEVFLMAFTRFAARRGPIHSIQSDCGTNFVGASRLFNSVAEYQTAITNHLATNHIQWHFNPPSAPNFGGLWEAGVKSVKQLLYRSIGSHRLTSEELSTYLTRIEATLNSRPLCAMSSDPADFNALTPNHFLTLEPSTTIPDPELSTIAMSKLQRWRLIRDIHQHFWSKWQSDYINTLQQRTKWTTNDGTLRQDDLVLIKEPVNPLQWKLGRIVQLHPGTDGISRVATVKTTTGTFKRPANKLCPLPQH